MARETYRLTGDQLLDLAHVAAQAAGLRLLAPGEIAVSRERLRRFVRSTIVSRPWSQHIDLDREIENELERLTAPQKEQ